MNKNINKEIRINEKKVVLNSLMQDLFLDLSDNEASIAKKRFGILTRKHTLEEIGQDYGVTRERIRQIENVIVKKVIVLNEKNENLVNLKNSIIEFVKEYGGIVEEYFLIDRFFENLNEDEERFVEFLLSKVLSNELVEYKTKNEKKSYYRLKEVAMDSLDKISDEVAKILESVKEPLTFDSIVDKLEANGVVKYVEEKLKDLYDSSKDDGKAFFKKALESYLYTSDVVKQNVIGLWGVGKWKTISPKRMADKIYIVLKKTGKPLHFKEITNLINESKFDKKPARDVTIHNELILDDRYVLVGRGIYALQEWGYKRGNVNDVIADVLKNSKNALTKAEIYVEVSKQKIVKESTIYLSLTSDKRFKKVVGGKYELIG